MSMKMVAWTLGCVVTSFLLVEHMHPSESSVERIYAAGLCTLANGLMLRGAMECLRALGV